MRSDRVRCRTWWAGSTPATSTPSLTKSQHARRSAGRSAFRSLCRTGCSRSNSRYGRAFDVAGRGYGDYVEPKVPRVRLRPVPSDALFVVRGDELEVALLREDAANFRERFVDWGRFGVSAFHARHDGEVDALCSTRLVRFEDVLVFRREHLVAAGIEVVPTFRTPHVTLCHTDLDELVSRLGSCEHERLTNPYHEAWEQLMMADDLDLRVDLNTEDDTGLPWAFLRDARDPSVIQEGNWIVVGSGSVRAVAQVVQVVDDLVWVRPLPGPVDRYRDLLKRDVA